MTNVKTGINQTPHSGMNWGDMVPAYIVIIPLEGEETIDPKRVGDLAKIEHQSQI